MTTLTTANFRLIDSGWDAVLASARKADASVLRVACPFMQQRPVQRLLAFGAARPLQVLTRFNLDDFADGVSDPRALRLLLAHGAHIRGIRNLHTKLYLVGKCCAIVTSANLTDAALFRNHEFGFVAEEQAIVARCREYFDKLWNSAGPNLTLERLEAWESRLAKHLASGARRTIRSALGDEGAVIDSSPVAALPEGWVAAADQAFVKLWGTSTNRLGHDDPISNELRRGVCHYAGAYPKGRRPRQVRDGALMFMGRLVKEPNDIRVFGRAIGIHHVPGRDDATPAEMQKKTWLKEWPHYIRVHDAVFLAGKFANGVSLNEMMDALGPEAFASTQANKAKGYGNLEPRKAYRQKAAVQLTEKSMIWLADRLEQAIRKHGTQPQAVIDSLDWPTSATRSGGKA